jgi:hypothetical protein
MVRTSNGTNRWDALVGSLMLEDLRCSNVRSLDASNCLGGSSGRLRRLLVDLRLVQMHSVSEAPRAFTEGFSTVHRGDNGTRMDDSSTEI